MQDFRPAIFVMGWLLGGLAVAMVVPAVMDFFIGSEEWKVFALSAVLTGFVAGGLILTHRGTIKTFTMSQAFALTGWSWVALAFFCVFAFCLWLCGLGFYRCLF